MRDEPEHGSDRAHTDHRDPEDDVHRYHRAPYRRPRRPMVEEGKRSDVHAPERHPRGGVARVDAWVSPSSSTSKQAAAQLSRSSPVVEGRDESRSSPMGREAERPADENEQPILEADQVPEVDDEPGCPGEKAAEPNSFDVGDRRCSADRGQVALVPVAEGVVLAPSQPRTTRWLRTALVASPRVRHPAARPSRRSGHGREPCRRSRTPPGAGRLRSASTVTRPARSGSAPVSPARVPARTR